MKSHAKFRKIASLIHGRRATYPVNGNADSMQRTVLVRDMYRPYRYSLKTYRGYSCSPANCCTS